MLIDSLTFTLEKSGCLDAFWGKLDAGEDGTLGVASSARPFLVAARFAHRPQPTLVVVAGEDAAVAFSRSLAAYLGDERVMRFPERSDYPFVPKPSDPAQVARRMEAVHALASGREVVVVASARALVRALPPAGSDVHVPVALSAGRELAAMPGAQAASVTEFEDFAHALEERGYRNTGELDGPGTFAVRGGTIDVFPGNLVYPVRLDFFGDELEEIRRIVPTTGQTIQALPSVSIYPVVEFSCSKRGLARARQKLERPAATNPVLRDVLEKLDGGLRFDGSDMLLPYLYATTSTLGDYVRPGALSVLLEPRSLFDDMSHAYDDAAGRAKGSSIPVDGLYAEPGGRELRRGAARNLRVHHARGRARGRRAAGEARGGGGASRQAVRSAAQPRGHRLHGGVQRVELPCAPGHEAGVRRPRSADPRDAGRGRGRRRTGRYRQAPSAAGRG